MMNRWDDATKNQLFNLLGEIDRAAMDEFEDDVARLNGDGVCCKHCSLCNIL